MDSRVPSRRPSTPALDTRWRAALLATVGLFVAAVVPSPFDRRPEWDRYGPDKYLHLVGHAGYTVTLADALCAGRWGRRDAAALAVGLSTAQSLLAGRLQERVPGRAFEVEDVVAGLVGAVLAASGWYVANGAPGGECGERIDGPMRSVDHHGSSAGPGDRRRRRSGR